MLKLLFLNGETEIIDVVEQYDRNEGVITLAPPQPVVAVTKFKLHLELN
jgi:hypothetical protein